MVDGSIRSVVSPGPRNPPLRGSSATASRTAGLAGPRRGFLHELFLGRFTEFREPAQEMNHVAGTSPGMMDRSPSKAKFAYKTIVYTLFFNTKIHYTDCTCPLSDGA